VKTSIHLENRIKAKPSRNGLKYHIKTFGCQMNEHDSEKIAGIFNNDGMSKSDDLENADVLFVNTCTIRENADDKLYGTLGQLKRWKSLSPNRRLLVGGCAAQKDKELVRERAPWVDVVIGTHNTSEIINLLNQAEDWGPITKISEESKDIETEIAAVRESSVSAFVTIQIGCNNSCTFCIVPSVRGVEISRRPSDIINEIKSLAYDGIKEITLLGQNVNSYGRDLMINDKRKPYFTELLYKIHEIDGIQRIRFTSPHPKDFKIETLKAVAELPKVANQIHIPLQSGSNKILSAMHRGYNQKRFLEKIDLIKSLIPNVSISSDIIVGFPGEDHEDFNQTMEVVNYSEFDLIYMFKFSPRPGTVASNYVHHFVSKDDIDDRFMRLKDRQTEISGKRYKRFENTSQTMLVEKVSKKDNKILTGRIEGGHIVHLESPTENIGRLLNVKIHDSTPFFLKATP
tara:strand:+ start:1965 stop:3338 length:1374 start_codon:yes stop_codon:yes gene_type:complete